MHYEWRESKEKEITVELSKFVTSNIKRSHQNLSEFFLQFWVLFKRLSLLAFRSFSPKYMDIIDNIICMCVRGIHRRLNNIDPGWPTSIYHLMMDAKEI